MSTRDDSRLTAEERAALSNLEALAAADDPQLAARLRGPTRWRLVVQVSWVLGWLPGLPEMRRWVTGLPGVHSLWVAVPAVIVGLALTVVSVSVGLAVGVIGAGIAAAGLWSVVTAAQRRWGGG
ncbi:MAG TPA: hypothetical protein VMO88_03650 [Acidimicrobiales bacterium]|nr:hypothetical protein [Acidimicrobiales bacterium]